jgi:hypothetical protein
LRSLRNNLRGKNFENEEGLKTNFKRFLPQEFYTKDILDLPRHRAEAMKTKGNTNLITKNTFTKF